MIIFTDHVLKSWGSIGDVAPQRMSSVWLKLLQKFSIRSIDQIKINAYVLGPGNSTCAGQVIILCAHFLMCKIEIILPPGVIVKVKLDDTHKALSTQGLAQGKCSGNVYNIITAAEAPCVGGAGRTPARCPPLCSSSPVYPPSDAVTTTCGLWGAWGTGTWCGVTIKCENTRKPQER